MAIVGALAVVIQVLVAWPSRLAPAGERGRLSGSSLAASSPASSSPGPRPAWSTQRARVGGPCSPSLRCSRARSVRCCGGASHSPRSAVAELPAPRGRPCRPVWRTACCVSCAVLGTLRPPRSTWLWTPLAGRACRPAPPALTRRDRSVRPRRDRRGAHRTPRREAGRPRIRPGGQSGSALASCSPRGCHRPGRAVAPWPSWRAWSSLTWPSRPCTSPARAWSPPSIPGPLARSWRSTWSATPWGSAIGAAGLERHLHAAHGWAGVAVLGAATSAAGLACWAASRSGRRGRCPRQPRPPVRRSVHSCSMTPHIDAIGIVVADMAAALGRLPPSWASTSVRREGPCRTSEVVPPRRHPAVVRHRGDDPIVGPEEDHRRLVPRHNDWSSRRPAGIATYRLQNRVRWSDPAGFERSEWREAATTDRLDVHRSPGVDRRRLARGDSAPARLHRVGARLDRHRPRRRATAVARGTGSAAPTTTPRSTSPPGIRSRSVLSRSASSPAEGQS